jgi:Sec-independent protein secretion pathway component TatC
MALPMWLLYEAGLIFARIMLRMRAGQPRDGEETRSG